jgi:ribosomal protein S18 acetylase RimI-like enzyme
MQPRRWHHIRRVAGDRTLVLRPLRPTDAAGLAALYRRLGRTDTYRRFFSAATDVTSVAAREVLVHDRGGLGLVLELVEADGHRSLVAAATAERLADGDGELAIAVDPDWRGWSGPFLLDALARAAGAAGMRNLQAEVLCENTPMLRLLRRRGAVVLGDGDWVTLRLAVGASERLPGWPAGAPHPRVLAEVPGGRWRDASTWLDLGGSVMTCPGPSPTSPAWCPVLRGTTCPLVEGADLVLCRLRDDEVGRGIREALPRLHPHVTIADQGPGVPPWGRERQRREVRT